MKKKFLAIVILTFVFLTLCSCVPNISPDDFDGEENPSDTAVSDTQNLLPASKALLSAVSVRCEYEEYRYSIYGAVLGTKKTASAGSGVIYKLDRDKGDAYIITNYHVVYNGNAVAEGGISDNIQIYLYGMEMMNSDGNTYAIPAVYVGGSMNYDIAVLRISASDVLKNSSAIQASVADSDGVCILDTAIAIGNPGDSGLSATVGYINVDSEDITVGFETPSGTQSVSLRVMRTDAAVNSGNSGGGLFNTRGELIGIVNAKDSDELVDNIGYAIPSNVAKAIADNAIYYSDGTVRRCLLGVTVGVKSYSTKYDSESGKVYRVEEVVVTELAETSAVLGLIEVGDVINSVTVDGKIKEVTRIHHLVDSMLYARVGSEVTVNVTRGGISMDISAPMISATVTK